MKLLVIFILSVVLSVPAFSQDGKKAKSVKEYVAMYNNPKYKMARNHAEFYSQAKKIEILKKFFSDRKFLMNFLTDMKFCKDGLITLRMGEAGESESFVSAVGSILGFETSFFGRGLKNSWCSGPATCSDAVNARCITRNCGRSTLKGFNFEPARILSP